MISIIVPVYRVEKYLRNCVWSIQNQSYSDLQIILVDDGSPDSSGKICDELAEKDERIKVIHQENRGLAAARNAGLDFVQRQDLKKNRYIAFVDSDDTIDSSMYEIMIALIEKDKADLVVCGHQSVAENGEPYSVDVEHIREKKLDKQGLWEEIFGKLNNAAWNKLYLGELIGDLRFPEGINHGEDLLFNIQYLSRCEQGIICTGNFYHYYNRPGSITRSKFNSEKFNEIIVKDRVKKIIEEAKPSMIAVADKYCFRARMNVLRSFYALDNRKEGYEEKIEECRRFIKENYDFVKKTLRAKERAEYNLFIHFNWLYRLLTRRRSRG